MGRTQKKTLRQLVNEAKAAGKTQEQFARERNLEPGQLSRLLAGKEPIGGRLAMRLQAITGIDAREFLSDEGR
jgi:transcriptional regulator with XRE-family HTH domain